jgi:DNA-binding beta-propeller fold protein YncE
MARGPTTLRGVRPPALDMRTRLLSAVVATAAVVAAVGLASRRPDATGAGEARASLAGTVRAPEFPAGLEWLNTAAPLTLKELRGKVVVLDFWTYGCINCMHDFPWIKKLEADFPDTLVVIGVHSAKFSEEGNTRNIREIILRYGLDYPVINDSRFEVWNEWGVSAWPTLAIVDPAGNVVTERAGEGFYPGFTRVIASLVQKFGAQGRLDRRPLKLKREKQGLPQTVLSFPGKVRVDPKGNRLFISDTDHNRIVVAALDSGEVLAVIGSGKRGFRDGEFANAEFDHPEGTVLSPDGETLYVADTENHSLREADLLRRRVTTLDGTGAQASGYPPPGGTAPGVALSSPWDLALTGDDLYIAMAGCHQIWRMDLRTRRIGPFAGTGAEGYEDGSLNEATLAQPSGLTTGPDGRIYFADSEGSSIRAVDPGSGAVVTVAGAGDSLFGFGYRDGSGRHARFQHPLGVVAYGGRVYVADTYNNRIRVVDPRNGAARTLAGGSPGWRDGKDPLFYEPGGIDAAHGTLYIADTNNHSIRTLDIATGAASTFVLKGVSRLARGDVYAGKEVRLQPMSVAAGKGSVRFTVELPDGFAPNPQAPSEVAVSSSGGDAIALTGPATFTGAGPRFPMTFPATFTPGSGEVTIDLSLVYCRETQASVCMITQARLELPVRVVGAGGTTAGNPVLDVTYTIR